MKISRRMGLIVAKSLVSIVLLVYLLSGMHWQIISDAFQQLPIWSFLAMGGCYFIAQILSCSRWHLICRSLQIRVKWRYLLDLYFLGMFFNLFLPTGVGGDVIKSYALGRSNQAFITSTHSVLFDRISGLVALLLIALFALACISIKQTWVSRLIIGLSLFSVGLLLSLPKIISLLSGTLPILSRYLEPIKQIYKDPKHLILLFIFALLIQSIGLFIVVGFGYLLGIQVPLSFYAISWTLITLMTTLPISINGIGVREAGFVYLFQLEGVSEELAVTLSILTFAIPAGISLLGVIPLLRLRVHTPLHNGST